MPLTERKRELKEIVADHPRVLAAGHLDDGGAFFKLVCELDLEGIVAKQSDGMYVEDWFKIRNRATRNT